MKKLDHLSTLLDPFDDELMGRACLVGFTANTWSRKNSTRQLSCNIQWVVVLA